MNRRTDHPQPPEVLRAAIARDLRPVRPLARPWHRAAALVPIALAGLLGIPWLLGPRWDTRVLGPGWSWGLSLLQLGWGLWLIGVALREAVPGRASATSTIVARLVATGALTVAITCLTYAVSPTPAADSDRALFFRYCLLASAVAGVPLLAAALLASARAFPLRPWVVGLFCGLGAGLATDAGWRLFCEVSEPRHVLLAHGGAIVILALAGAGISSLLARARGHVRTT